MAKKPEVGEAAAIYEARLPSVNGSDAPAVRTPSLPSNALWDLFSRHECRTLAVLRAVALFFCGDAVYSIAWGEFWVFIRTP